MVTPQTVGAQTTINTPTANTDNNTVDEDNMLSEDKDKTLSVGQDMQPSHDGCQSGSSDACRSLESTLLSTQTNARSGLYALSTKLRSVVMSETTFETFIGFNSNDSSLVDVNDDFVRGICSSIADEKGLPSLDFWKGTEPGLLTTPANTSKLETSITQEMVSHLNEHFKKGNTNLFAVKEGNLPRPETNGNSNPRLDFTIGVDDRLLAFAEVGLVRTRKKNRDDFSKP